MTLDKLKQIIQDESVSGRLKALEEFEERLSDQRRELEYFANNIAHKELDYDDYSDLMDMIQDFGE